MGEGGTDDKHVCSRASECRGAETKLCPVGAALREGARTGRWPLHLQAGHGAPAREAEPVGRQAELEVRWEGSRAGSEGAGAVLWRLA